MRLDDFPDDRQAEASAAGRGRVSVLEDRLAVVIRDVEPLLVRQRADADGDGRNVVRGRDSKNTCAIVPDTVRALRPDRSPTPGAFGRGTS